MKYFLRLWICFVAGLLLFSFLPQPVKTYLHVLVNPPVVNSHFNGWHACTLHPHLFINWEIHRLEYYQTTTKEDCGLQVISKL